MSFLDPWERGCRDKADKQVLSRKTSLIWRCSCHDGSTASSSHEVTHSTEQALPCRRGCSAAVQPCPHSLPWDLSLGNSYCTLVMLAPLDRPLGLGSIWGWSVDPRKIQQPMRRQLMGILIKSTAYDALGMQWHFLPTALVIAHETNLLGVSLAVCSKIYCLWLLQSLSLLMNMSLECFHDRKVI